MEINQIGTSNNNSLSSNNQNTNTNETSERDLFMTLLVAQLKNQDPLAPQQGAEFVAQLAQFNSLDQLVGIRQSIDQLVVSAQQQTPNTTA